MRLARKAGPEHVAGLKRERAAALATRKWEIAENRRVTAEKRRATVQDCRRAKGLPEEAEPGEEAPPGGFEYVGQPQWDEE